MLRDVNEVGRPAPLGLRIFPGHLRRREPARGTTKDILAVTAAPYETCGPCVLHIERQRRVNHDETPIEALGNRHLPQIRLPAPKAIEPIGGRVPPMLERLRLIEVKRRDVRPNYTYSRHSA